MYSEYYMYENYIYKICIQYNVPQKVYTASLRSSRIQDMANYIRRALFRYGGTKKYIHMRLLCVILFYFVLR